MGRRDARIGCVFLGVERLFWSRYAIPSWSRAWRSAAERALRWLGPAGMLFVLGWALEARIEKPLWILLLLLPPLVGGLSAWWELLRRPARLRVRPGWMALDRQWDLLRRRDSRFRRLVGVREGAEGELLVYLEGGDQEVLYPEDWPGWRMLVGVLRRSVHLRPTGY
nr:MAG: hypothetical protein KatS3mg041_1046 [Bacteroidota bacterium]